MAATLETTEIQHGIYKCRICEKEYTVNKPDSWDRCTPEYCHECAPIAASVFKELPSAW